MKDQSFFAVYYAKIPNEIKFEKIFPKQREDEINSSQNERIKRQKYCVWKLLEMAVNECIGGCFDEINFQKNVNGKWECEEFYFSLSHSEKYLAVALSNFPVGVDVQIIRSADEKIADKILNELERTQFDLLKGDRKQSYLLGCWAKKECLLKVSGEGALKPKQRNTVGVEFFEREIGEEEKYLLVAYCEKIGIEFCEIKELTL